MSKISKMTLNASEPEIYDENNKNHKLLSHLIKKLQSILKWAITHFLIPKCFFII